MRFLHPQFPDRRVRLGYCSNLHAGESVRAIRAGLEEFTLPLKQRLGVTGAFGVGLYLPAPAARHLASEEGSEDLAEWIAFCGGEGIDPFTFNAFPYGDFQQDGLKEAVYEPLWSEIERGQYTFCVAQVAQALQAGLPFSDPRSHISISTHPGAHVSQVDGTAGLHACSRGLAAAVLSLVQTQREDAPPVVLSVEAEPWAIAGDSLALAEYLVVVAVRAAALLRDQGQVASNEAERLVAQHLGTCLDACHSAVEFETVEAALRLAASQGPLGKLQYSSALRLRQPAAHAPGQAALLGLDEARFLHQVNGRPKRVGQALLRAEDLPALRTALQDPAQAPAWQACDEWRCHFHVPVDMPHFEGLETTRDYADKILLGLLAAPETWRTQELHVEIETYTWSVLPGVQEGSVLDGMQAEYEHVLDCLARSGWRSAD